MTVKRWIPAFLLAATFLLCSGIAWAQPVVNSAVNAASFASTDGEAPKLARGGIFSIFGTAVGGAAFSQASSFPLPTELGGSSAAVTVNGVTRSAILTFSTATQINAILPSDLPSGAGTLTVTYNGQTSAPFAVEVVDHFFGVFTIGSAGVGTAVVTDPLDANPSTWINLATRPAVAGSIWDIWGTGLGPIDASDALAAPLVDQTHVDVKVLVGGVPAQILFRGRSPCCAGLDQIRFVVPQGALGCCVTLEVVVDGITANSVGLSVSQDSRMCERSAFNDLFGDTNLDELLQRGRYSYGSFSASRTVALSSPVAGTLSESSFGSLQQADFTFAGCGVAVDTTTAPRSLPVGDCITTRIDFTFSLASDFSFSSSTVWEWAAFEKDGRFIDEVRYETHSSSATPEIAPKPTPRLVEGLFAVSAFRSLDAGAALTLSGPGGTQTLSKLPPSLPFFTYSWNQQQNFTTAIPNGALRAGTHTMAGPGGADVPAFSFDFEGFAPLQLLNAAEFAAPISLDQPLRFAWDSTASSVPLVGVGGSSGRGGATPTGSSTSVTLFSCAVDYGPGSYSVPVSVLRRMVASDPSTPGAGGVAISAVSGELVNIPGVDVSSATWVNAFSQPATFVGGAAAAISEDK